MALLLFSATSRPRAASPLVRSATIAITSDGTRVVTINPDSNSITTLDTKRELVVCTTPQTLSIDGARVFVVCRDGSLNEIDLDAMRVTRAVAAGFDPFGVVASGGRVYVSTHDGIAVFDETTLARVTTIATEEFSHGLAIDGGKLYVTHFRSGKLSIIDLASLAVINVIATGLDSNVSQSVVISGMRAYLPQTRSNSNNPALIFDSTAFPIVTVIDLANGVNLSSERIAIDIADRPSSLPVDIALTSDGRAFVVNAGSDDVSIIDLAQRRAIAHLQVGSSPRGIALSPDERFAYVNNTLSGSVSVIDTRNNTIANTIATTTIPLDSSILNGKILFNTSNQTTLAKDRWIACATCHFDGGTDGRTWFFKDGPRNTPPLFGIGETLPMHWSGDLDELQDVESTIRNIQAGTGLASGASNCEPSCDTAPPNAGRSKDLDDLAAFMRSLRAAPRVIALGDAALRGRALFASSGCASCHVPPLYVDQKKHDVGTGSNPLEHKGTSFDTPSLRGVADSAPYFHDGSAATLIDVVDTHGSATTLTSGDKNDLVAFLRTISFSTTPERRRAVKK